MCSSLKHRVGGCIPGALFSLVVFFGDAGDRAGGAAAAMVCSEVPGGHLLSPVAQRMGRGHALAA